MRCSCDASGEKYRVEADERRLGHVDAEFLKLCAMRTNTFLLNIFIDASIWGRLWMSLPGGIES